MIIDSMSTTTNTNINSEPSIDLSTRINSRVIHKHIELLHKLAEGFVGKLVLWTKTQEPDGKAECRAFHFAIGDIEGMAAAASQEAAKSWTNVFFGAYVIKPDLPLCARRASRHCVERRFDVGGGSG